VPPTDEELDELAHDALESAWEGRRISSPPPTWYLVDDDYHLVIMVTPWRGRAEKEAMARVVAVQVKKMRCRAVVGVSDAWYRDYSPEDAPGPEERGGVDLSVDPFAKECLMVQQWRRGSPFQVTTRVYRRRDDGELEILEDQTLGDGSGGYAETETFASITEAMA
jgi:hypothetical protein